NSGQSDGGINGINGKDIGAQAAWDITTGSSNVVVAVIDSGVDYLHPDLAANIFENTSECLPNGIDDDGNGYIDDCHGIDTVNGDSDPMDDDGHGTHVAGIIGAIGNNGVGIAGIAWNVKILPCKFLDANGGGTTADAITCIDYVSAMKDRGVNIVATNASWGGTGYSQALYDAIDGQRQRGILFTTSAGNDGTSNDIVPSYPCAFELANVICVAMTNNLGLPAFGTSDGDFSVLLSAPGQGILSTLPGNQYGRLTGTSMAAPHVAGVVALLASQNSARGWLANRNLILSSARLNSGYESTFHTITQRTLNAQGALNCTNQVIKARVRPNYSFKEIQPANEPILLEVLHLACENPNGDVTVTISPGGATITLHDDGLDGDKLAGDGLYSAIWTPTVSGNYTLTFGGSVNDSVNIVVDSQLRHGFPQRMASLAGSYHGPIYTMLADVRGDGNLEIAATGLAQGPLYLWNADGSPVSGWPILANGAAVLRGAAYPVMAQLDATTTRKELFVAYYGGTVAGYDVNANALPGWPVTLNAPNGLEQPTVAGDINSDGRDELFVYNNGMINALSADGTPYPGWVPYEGSIPNIADLDGDGTPEIISVSLALSNQPSRVTAIHADGTSLPGFPVTTAQYSLSDLSGSPSVIGDIDGDGHNEIVTFGYGHVFKVSDTGVISQVAQMAESPLYTTGALADLDGDGIPEVIAQAQYSDSSASSHTIVYAWHGDGSLVAGFPYPAPQGVAMGFSSPVIGDIDGDGYPDILFSAQDNGTQTGFLYALDRHGMLLDGFPKKLTMGGGTVAAIGDLDRNGHNDFVIASSAATGAFGLFDGVWAFEMPGPVQNGPIEWGQLGGGASHQGYYELGKNLPNSAFLTAHVRGTGAITSSPAGINCGSDCIERYAKGTAVTLTATGSAGAAFVSWLGACAGQGNPCTVSLQKYTSVVAQFSTNVLTVNTAGSGTGTVVSSPAGISCPGTCSVAFNPATLVTLTANPGPDSTFTGWSGACAGSANPCQVTLTSAKSITANFEHGQTLTVNKTGSGAGTVAATPAGISCGQTCSHEFDFNTIVHLVATPDADAIFTGWSGACTGAASTCDVTMSGAHMVTADFEKRWLTVSVVGGGNGVVTSNPAGINCGTVCSDSYAFGAAVVLTATPASDSVFGGWSGGACVGSELTCTINMAAVEAATATFVLKPALTVTMQGMGTGTVTSAPAGINCGTDCTESYQPNTQVTLTAAPASGSEFQGWSGACSGTAPTCIVTLDSAKTVGAGFGIVAPSPPATGGNKGGGGGGSLDWLSIGFAGLLLFHRQRRRRGVRM
ncbi:MAG TPA: S8 family serine peptidase, partial [Steroidobacteraceae bacterium]